MQENGALLIGEPSGGGSCAIQFAALSDGIVFQLSSYLWAEEDADGESVESGCKTDIPIARIEPEPLTYPAPLFSSGDYSPYFDEIMLDQIINEWFR